MNTSTATPPFASSSASSATCLAEALARPVQQTPDQSALIFLTGDQPALNFTYAQMWAAAEREAARLLAAGIRAGDRLLLVGQQDPHLVQVWIGAVIVGAIPAISPYLPSGEPGEGASSEAAVGRAVRFAIKSGTRGLLTPAAWQPVMTAALAAQGVDEAKCAVLEVGAPGLPDDSLPAVVPYSPDPTVPAYIQLTSGTTGDSKGTLISHTALLEHVRQMQSWFEVGAQDVVVGWLPFSHDLGLMAQLFVPWITGYPSVLLSPEQWVRRPRILLRAVQTFGATYFAMPTFGYAHCTQHIRDEELDGVDLSRLRFCVVGAEVIPAATMEAFAKRFAPWGLRPTMLVPAYGLAEAVMAVTLTPLQRGMRVDRVEREAFQRESVARPVAYEPDAARNDDPAGDSIELVDDPASDHLTWVSCGSPLPDTRVEIVNGAGVALPERRLGQVVIYREGLGTAPVGEQATATPGVVRTRDIGYLADGELFVCGRQDDLMILGGANLYPEAIEMTALAVIGQGAGRAAAFGVRDRRLSTETAVLVCEVRGTLDAAKERELSAAIRRAVRTQHEIVLGDLYFVRRGWIETSDSGKVARQATQAKYLAAGRMAQLSFLPEIGHLAHVGPDQVAALAQALADRVALMLGLTGAGMGVGVHDDVLDLGLTSLTATALMAQLRRERAKPVAIERWVENSTCAHLAALLLDAPYVPPAVQGTAPETKPESAVQRAAEDETAVTPVVTPKATAVYAPNITPVAITGTTKSLGLSRQRIYRWLWGSGLKVGSISMKAPGLLLPYGLGVRIQRALFAQPWVQQRFFSSEIKVLTDLLTRVGRTADATTILQHLMFNHWTIWRQASLYQPEVTARWLQVSGHLQLAAEHLMGCGVVLAVLHTPAMRLITYWVRSQGRQTFSIRVGNFAGTDPNQLTPLWIKQLHQAGVMLEQGETVLVAVDGEYGEGGTPLEIGNGVRQVLYHGAAELAVQHNAALIPVNARLGIDGVVQLEFQPRLNPSLEAADPVAALMANYAEYHRQQLPHELQYLASYYLRTLHERIGV